MFFKTLSGRFLLLTIIFVMVAEVFIFVPSVARFRVEYLQQRLELAQLASLALLATPDDMVTPELANELLANAEVLNIVLRRNEMRELILSNPMVEPVSATYDLRDAGPFELIKDAMIALFNNRDEVIRIIGRPVKGAGIEIETTLEIMPLRYAMLEYGRNIFLISLLISVFSSAMLFIAVRRLMVRPIRKLVQNMMDYQQSPEDATRVIKPENRVIELRAAEDTLLDLQTQLTGSLKQKERLAQLGEAVAKISHDLRNILTTTQLLADRIETSTDPTVARIAPKLVSSVDRAINLCEQTLTYGKAEEAPPRPELFLLAGLVEEITDNENLHDDAEKISLRCDFQPGFELSADREQMFRVLGNLMRNARQVMETMPNGGEICIRANHTPSGVQLYVCDTGPGLPEAAKTKLFQPFQGSVRKGGTGLGLAIAAELVRGHGGNLELAETSSEGTCFRIFLPQKH
ncbi:MAG: HAMP domain-containing histidine kinase [Rhodobacteraceae bacterium]|nr:HAMP domain-containing histidine kinase [Paracoccaceae bacterium]